MKALIIFITMMVNAIVPSFAQTAYEKAMAKELEQMQQARTNDDLQNVANAFVRIAERNTSEWLPQYYTAFTYANMAFRSAGSPQEKDALFAQAKKHAEKAQAIDPANAEIVALQGYILMGELSVDPSSRGQSMSGLVMQTFGKAIGMDPTNPRALCLMAQMEAGTAKFFGQGPEKACSMAKSSLQLFDNEAAGSTPSLLPRWGRQMAEQLLSGCEG